MLPAIIPLPGIIVVQLGLKAPLPPVAVISILPFPSLLQSKSEVIPLIRISVGEDKVGNDNSLTQPLSSVTTT